MKLLVSRAACWIITCGVLSLTMILLATSRLEYCGQPECLQPRIDVASTRWPTLAPRQNVVFIQIESGKPDLEIGWAGN